jgi:hypothetical protein
MMTHIERLERHLEKLDHLHSVIGYEVEEARAALSTLKASLGQAGQPELPLAGAGADSAGAGTADPTLAEDNCSCGHPWHLHTFHPREGLSCSLCKCTGWRPLPKAAGTGTGTGTGTGKAAESATETGS